MGQQVGWQLVTPAEVTWCGVGDHEVLDDCQSDGVAECGEQVGSLLTIHEPDHITQYFLSQSDLK